VPGERVAQLANGIVGWGASGGLKVGARMAAGMRALVGDRDVGLLDVTVAFHSWNCQAGLISSQSRPVARRMTLVSTTKRRYDARGGPLR